MKQIRNFTLPLAAFALMAASALGMYAHQSQAQTVAQTVDSVQIDQAVQTDQTNGIQVQADGIQAQAQTQTQGENDQQFDDGMNQMATDGNLTEDQEDGLFNESDNSFEDSDSDSEDSGDLDEEGGFDDEGGFEDGDDSGQLGTQ